MVIAAVSPAIYLLALACPIGMVLMMLFMGKSMGGKKRGGADEDERALADLKAEQARLAEKIAALEATDHDGLPEPLPSSDGQEAEQARQTTPS